MLRQSCLVFTFLPALLFASYMYITDNSVDVNHVLYGDITRMDDMFITPADYEDDDDKYPNIEQPSQNNRRAEFHRVKDFLALELEPNPFKETRLDIEEFNKITKSLRNFTRRIAWDDPDDNYRYLEPYKKQELLNCGIQFLIHTRYTLTKAFKQKESIKTTKRYRLGYLFNKLRRIQYDMARIIDQAKKQGYYVETLSVFELYETVVRDHVDVVDTIALIKAIDLEHEQEEFTTVANSTEQTTTAAYNHETH